MMAVCGSTHSRGWARTSCGSPSGVMHRQRSVTALDEPGSDTGRAQQQELHSGAQGVAICFLYSFVNPSHERRAAEIIREMYPDLALSLSCEVDPAFVQDRFNLYGLKEIVGPLYGEAMTMILGYAPTGALVHQSSRLTPHWGASGPAPGLLCEQDGAVSSGRRALACGRRTLRLRCSSLCRAQRSSCPTRRSASTRYWRPRASSTG